MSGLYVHVPFCARVCPYCDFDVRAGKHPDLEAFLAALELELHTRDDVVRGRALRTVYIGGGTPSLLGPDGIARLFALLRAWFEWSEVDEVTLEVNPEDGTEALLDALVAVGVTRVSVGVQSFQRPLLRVLGRVHDGARAHEVLRAAKDRGLRVSADIILGAPGQDLGSLREDLEHIVVADVGHVSVYALTIESDSAWEALVRRGRRQLPDADQQAALLAASEAELLRHGFVHYEISSYAKHGQWAEHNSGYWSWRDYLGIGPSAASARHTADGGVWRRTNLRGFQNWCAAPGRGQMEESLAPQDAAREGLWLALRRLDGCDMEAFRRRFPRHDRAWLERLLGDLMDAGRVRWDAAGTMLSIAPGQWLWHDRIATQILAP